MYPGSSYSRARSASESSTSNRPPPSYETTTAGKCKSRLQSLWTRGRSLWTRRSSLWTRATTSVRHSSHQTPPVDPDEKAQTGTLSVRSTPEVSCDSGGSYSSHHAQANIARGMYEPPGLYGPAIISRYRNWRSSRGRAPSSPVTESSCRAPPSQKLDTSERAPQRTPIWSLGPDNSTQTDYSDNHNSIAKLS